MLKELNLLISKQLGGRAALFDDDDTGMEVESKPVAVKAKRTSWALPDSAVAPKISDTMMKRLVKSSFQKVKYLFAHCVTMRLIILTNIS